MNSRKGVIAADKSVYYIIFGFVLTAFFIIFAMIMKAHINDTVKIPEALETNVIALRFFTNCFNYVDSDLGRAYPFTVDIAKFNQYFMDRCYNVPKDHKEHSFELILVYYVENTVKDKTLKSANYHKTLTKAFTRSVRVYDSGKVYDGKMKVWYG